MVVPRVFREIAEERASWINNAAARSIGLDKAVDALTPDILAKADDAISEGFQGIIEQASEGGLPRVFNIGEELSTRIMDTKGSQIPRLMARGRFQGLEDGALAGPEIMIARRALAQDAAAEAGRGRFELADDIFADIEQLDRIFEGAVRDPTLLARHARLREQYRNLQILMKPGVIGKTGDVSPTTLANRMAQGTGYGRVYQQGRTAGLQPETQELFTATRQLSAPELQPFRSSGTAENQAIRDLGNAISGAVADPVAGGAGLATRLYAPAVLSTLGGTNAGASALGGLLQPSPALLGRAGGEIGPGILETLLLDSLRGGDGQSTAVDN